MRLLGALPAGGCRVKSPPVCVRERVCVHIIYIIYTYIHIIYIYIYIYITGVDPSRRGGSGEEDGGRASGGGGREEAIYKPAFEGIYIYTYIRIIPKVSIIKVNINFSRGNLSCLP